MYVCLGVRVCMRVRCRRLFRISRWHLVGAFHKATESTAIDLVEVLLDESVKTTAVNLVKVLFDEPVEPTAVDFVKVPFLTTERYATENNRIQYKVDIFTNIPSPLNPKIFEI